jgi:hypothetical protein
VRFEEREVDVTKRAIAGLLVWQLGAPAAPLMAGEAASSGEDRYWIEATLLAIDSAGSRVTYRMATGDVRTSPVKSAAALEKLSSWKPEQKVKLKVSQAGADGVVVEEVKKGGKGRNWWKWGLLIVLVGVGLLFWAASTADYFPD